MNAPAPLLVLGLVGLGCAHDQPPLHPIGPEGRFHIVMAGETLPDIAARAGVPLEDLAEINGLPVDGVVQSGDVIFVLAPTPGVPARPQEPPEIAPGPTAQAQAENRAAGSSRFSWPLAKVEVTSQFGKRWGRQHEGIDLGADKGTPVLAAAAGVVLYAGSTLRGYGRMVVLQHPNDYLTAYAHNSALLVQVGERVRQGQVIARVGQSGRATAPHLHFEVRKGQVPVDPLRVLPPPPRAR